MPVVTLRCTSCRQFRIELDLKEIGDVDSWADYYNMHEEGDTDNLECFYCSGKLERTNRYNYVTVYLVDDEEIGLKFGKEIEPRQEFLKPDEEFSVENFHVREKVKQIPLPDLMTAEEAREQIYDTEREEFKGEIKETIQKLEEQGYNFPNKPSKEEV